MRRWHNLPKGRFFSTLLMKVIKFGGTSLSDGKKMLNVARLIKKSSRQDKIVVVASAMRGTTDILVSVFQKYKRGLFARAFSELNQLYRLHISALDELKFKEELYLTTEKKIVSLFDELSFYLTRFSEDLSASHYAYVVSFGERLSSNLLAGALKKLGVAARAIDSGNVIITTKNFLKAKVMFTPTQEKAKQHLKPLLAKNVVAVVTGFFGASKDGTVTTLGRGGSDYSATILANVLDANEVILWRDTSKILHPQAFVPTAAKKIPVRIKSSLN